ncbi:MAG: hypothetical protein F6K11_15815 [Leptolyngbya sp. SIO3F4]|nr:hypothetical protein [Leptolyngbya sp. SIO3F4]
MKTPQQRPEALQEGSFGSFSQQIGLQPRPFTTQPVAGSVLQRDSLQPRPFTTQPVAESVQSVGQSPSFNFSDINVMEQQTASSPWPSPNGLTVQPVDYSLGPSLPFVQKQTSADTVQRVIEAKSKEFVENDDLFLDWQERFLKFNIFESYEVNGYIDQIQKGTISDSFEEIRLRLEADYQPESVVSKLIEDLKAISGTEKEAPIRYYSHADPSIEIDKEHAVITAMMTGSGYGHTRIYIEYLEGGKPKTVCTDLIVVSYEEKDKEDKVVVNIDDLQGDQNLKKYMSNPSKKTWAISQGEAVKAVQKAHTVQAEAKEDKYLYSRHGGRDITNLFSSKKLVNCARYGVKILKAAGVKEASAGKVIRLPETLVAN